MTPPHHIKRFDHVYDPRMMRHRLSGSPEGEWVRWEDVRDLVELALKVKATGSVLQEHIEKNPHLFGRSHFQPKCPNCRESVEKESAHHHVIQGEFTCRKANP